MIDEEHGQEILLPIIARPRVAASTPRNFKPKKCEHCRSEYTPRSGRSKWCDACRDRFEFMRPGQVKGRGYDATKRSRAYERVKADPEKYARHLEHARVGMRARTRKGKAGEPATTK